MTCNSDGAPGGPNMSLLTFVPKLQFVMALSLATALAVHGPYRDYLVLFRVSRGEPVGLQWDRLASLVAKK